MYSNEKITNWREDFPAALYLLFIFSSWKRFSFFFAIFDLLAFKISRVAISKKKILDKHIHFQFCINRAVNAIYISDSNLFLFW